jgi:hypothetical protein
MHRRHRLGVALVALALLTSGCYGPFNLTRRLYQWNSQVQGKWEKEFMFLILAYIPIYGLTIVGDAVVFNSMEFWTGNNPVDPPGKKSELPQTKRIARGDDETVLTYLPVSEGAQLVIEQFRKGQAVGRLEIARRDGITVGLDEQGRVLLSARALSDGGILVRDGQGEQVASYSADDVADFFSSAPR